MGHPHHITRRIEIDAAHRVPNHSGKCRHLHGHRYAIEADCAGELSAAGVEEGMVLDFGFLKDEMLAAIDADCDHAAILWREDPLVAVLSNERAVDAPGVVCTPFGRVLVLPFVPTAENLARFWFERLSGRVEQRSAGRARLVELRVWETPNACAMYRKPS